MVHLVGLEPTSLAALEPESSVCANFTTGANEEIVYQKLLRAVNPPSMLKYPQFSDGCVKHTLENIG